MVVLGIRISMQNVLDGKIVGGKKKNFFFKD